MKSLLDFKLPLWSILAILSASLVYPFTAILAQSNTTFTDRGVTYTVTVKESSNQNRAFTLSYPQNDGNTHILEYQGTCGAETVDVLAETLVNPQGKVIYQEIATEAIAYDISPNSVFEMSGTIRQALKLIC